MLRNPIRYIIHLIQFK